MLVIKNGKYYNYFTGAEIFFNITDISRICIIAEKKGIVPNAVQLEFAQRYVYGGGFRTETWEQYQEKHKEKFKRLVG